MALSAWEAMRCPSCHNYDSMVELDKDARHVTWDEHGGQKFVVSQYRCLACGAADLIKRDWLAKHENTKPLAGQAAPGDGRMFITRPLNEEETP